MTSTKFPKNLSSIFGLLAKSGRLLVLTLIAAFTAMAMQPAQAQTASDTWKSVAIIGGSTAAGAYIGHKVAGRTGAVIGAGVGASAGYAIDRRRRANEYYNQNAYYGDGGGYYPSNGGYYGNGGYSDPNAGYPYPYPSGYQSNYRSSRQR